VEVDGVAGTVHPHARIEHLQFHPDGSAIYVLRTGHRSCVVVHGKPGPAFEEIGRDVGQRGDLYQVGLPAVDPASGRVCYIGRRAGAWHVVIDGRPGPAYDELGHVVYGEGTYPSGFPRFVGGGHVAFRGRRGKAWFQVLDGTRGPAFEAVGAISCSADGAHFVYPARDHGRWVMVRDGRVVAGTEGTMRAVLGPAGRRVARIVRAGERVREVIDGIGVGAWDEVYYAAFTTDGAHLLTLGCVDGPVDYALGIDGRVLRSQGQGEFEIHHAPGGQWGHVGNRDGEHVMIRGVAGPTFDRVTGLCFSPDGRHWAHEASPDGDRHLVVRDGAPSRLWDLVWEPVFSPDSRRLAYGASLGDRAFLVVDGEVGPSFGWIQGDPVFSAKGAHVAYVARSSRFGGYRVVLDGHAGPLYPRILADRVFVEDDGTVTYHVKAGGRLLRVVQRLSAN
jgi:hypothetical protein